MLSRLRRNLSPSMVVASIALFAALGGGYAVAFSGSGTLQKAGLSSLTNSNSYTNFRTLNSFGTIQARCETDGSPDTLNVRLNNTTSDNIVARAQIFNDSTINTETETINAGNQQTNDFLLEQLAPTARIHLFELTTGSKAGVDIVVSATVAGGFCSNPRIMALNTQE